jgi:superfamily II DNA or RNA helicase
MVRPGNRVRARGLIWDVLEVDHADAGARIGLRCVAGDMAGLEWEVYAPPERLDVVDATFDPRRPVALSTWRTMHQAHILSALSGETSAVARNPGRVQVEPYQLVPLMRALDLPRPRLLLADGVGLGKTIQAGMIAAELIARRRAHRILIVVPSGPLLMQWEQETRLRFGLKFTLVTSAAELWDVRRSHELGANPFDAISLCITALDFAKQDYVLEELERSAWDLVIIDEAHHCVGFGTHVSQENTWRRRLAEVLARRSDGLLLLTATPHDGHDAHFASLVALLDPSLVDGAGGFVGQAYRRHVIRRMKAHIRDPRTGAPLFRRRHVVPVKVDVNGVEHEAVRDFHRALSAFVVPRLRRRQGADDGLAFVSLLKRSVSTISACLETLRVVVDRLARHEAGDIETNAVRRERARALRAWRRRVARFGSLSATDEANQTALEIESMAEALRIDPDSEPARLIRLGVAAEAHDPKLSAMVLEVRLIRLRHARTNVLIYTEYADSQAAAARALRCATGIEGEVLTIGGEDDDKARATAVTRFAESDGLILISTDSLAEGLNLHRFCFHLIHLDLPYNPNRLEQRNGRIDRYGQQREPEIRYLYIPGTFEENLLLHLIAKYEKARSSLDVMPDTLGMTAEPDAYAATLTSGLAEVPADLFAPDSGKTRTLDSAVGDSNPETIARLMREIDRAFDAFDLMAVCHGWYDMRGADDGAARVMAKQDPLLASMASEDLADFVGAVIAAETGHNPISRDRLWLPSTWLYGLEGLPGVDASDGAVHFSHAHDIWHDTSGRTTGYFGRAHPLVLQAIRHGIGLDGAVSVAFGKHLGLLLTFEVEIMVTHLVAYRQIVAVMAQPDRPPAEASQWFVNGMADFTACQFEQVWDRWFAPWAEPARVDAGFLADRIAAQRHSAFVARYEASRTDIAAQSLRWLRARADLLCGGAFAAPTGDLFGKPDSGPAWRYEADPVSRLISLATHPDTAAAKRREANGALETFRDVQATGAMPDAAVSRPIGLLMVVPRDAC